MRAGAMMMALVATLLAAAPAQSEPLTPQQSASRRAWITQANDAYARGEYGVAIQLYERAYAMHPDPSLLYRIGQAYEASEDWEGARKRYEQYLSANPQSGYAVRIKAHMERLREREGVGQSAITITTQPLDAQIELDGVVQSAARPLSVALVPGTHTIIVRREGYSPQREVIEVAPGERLERAYVLEPPQPEASAPPEPAPAPDPVIEPEPDEAPRRRMRPVTEVSIAPPIGLRILGWSATGIGTTALALSALIFWALPESRATPELIVMGLTGLALTGGGVYILFVRDWGAHLPNARGWRAAGADLARPLGLSVMWRF